MRILLIFIVICLLITGCARAIDTSDTPVTINSPGTIKNAADDFKLLLIATIPRLTEDGIAKDKIFLYDSMGISMPEKYNVAIPEEASEETRKVSNDLKRILIEKYIGDVFIYIVYDIETEKIIFTKNIDTIAKSDSEGRIKYHVFSPSLNKALYEDVEQNKVYLVNTITGEEILLLGIERINIIYNVVFSEDESKFAFINESDNGEKIIGVYDLVSNSITTQVKIGKGNVYLSQYSNNKILYNNKDIAYYVDLEASDIHVLGQYMFYPLLSPDGRYIAFSKPEEFTYYDTTTGMGFYSEEDMGLYIMDLTNNKIERITTDIQWDYIPFLWFTD